MRTITKLAATLFFLLASTHALVKSVQADEDFDVSQTSTYIVTSEGKTHVQHEMTITNKTIERFVTQYQLKVGSTRLTNIWAKDDFQDLEPNAVIKQNLTEITVETQQKAVGKGKKLHLRVGYDDDDIAAKIGRIWEINIPKPENVLGFTEYQIQLVIPNDFEPPVQIIPQPSQEKRGDTTTTYFFDRTKLQERGITALFGEKQIFSFDLRYTLKNESPLKQTQTIALPPDTLYQTMVYKRIEPKPESIKTDNDGNWIASFTLKPREILEVKAEGDAILYLKPQIKNTANIITKDSYLKAQDSWQIDYPEIKKLAESLKNPENIYNFVVDHLNYNYDRVNKPSRRQGAINALNNPDDAICMEFTDLFIALARAADIPARELNGFAYTQNLDLRPLSLKQDILHAWPEYYDEDKKIWIPVDPTWGKTTQGIDYFTRFDLNHFVFVIHGEKSQTPFPAGFYKLNETEGKDVIVIPTSTIPETDSPIDIEILIPNNIPAGIKSSARLNVTNLGGKAFHNLPVVLDSFGFDILTDKEFNIDFLPPFTTESITLTLLPKNLMSERLGFLNVLIATKTYEKQFQITNPIKKAPQVILTLALAAALAKTALGTRSLFISLRKKRSSLRR